MKAFAAAAAVVAVLLVAACSDAALAAGGEVSGAAAGGGAGPGAYGTLLASSYKRSPTTPAFMDLLENKPLVKFLLALAKIDREQNSRQDKIARAFDLVHGSEVFAGEEEDGDESGGSGSDGPQGTDYYYGYY